MSNFRQIKVAQINLARSQAASDDLYKYCITNSIDIAIVQEPYTRWGKLTNLEYEGVRIAKSKSNDQNGVWSAIVVLNQGMDILLKPQLVTVHTVTLSVAHPGQQPIDIVSSYFQFRKETRQFIDEITYINQHLAKRAIFGMDVNAFSPWWHGPRRNEKGRLVEAMIYNLDLTVENRPTNCWSFHGARGNSNVDVTLSRELNGKVTRWAMEDSTVASDHSLITFTLEDSVTLVPRMTKIRFNDRKIGSDRLRTAVANNIVSQPRDGTLDGDARAITNAINIACRQILPRSRKNKPSKPPWWNTETTHSRQTVTRLKRLMLRSGERSDREAYNAARNVHVSNIRKAKKNIWMSFVNDPGTTKSPWGKLTKWLINGRKDHVIPSVLQRPDGAFTEDLG